MSKIGGGPAFPVECVYTEDGSVEGRQTADSCGWHTGMSLRDFFAAHALMGQLANANGSFEMHKAYASESYAYADAMIAERSKGRQGT